MLVLLAVLQLQAAVVPSIPDDSLPTVTLAQALRRATGLDPNYVAAVGLVDNARWARRSAFAVFLLPAVGVETDATKNIPQFFSCGSSAAGRGWVWCSRKPPSGSRGSRSGAGWGPRARWTPLRSTASCPALCR